MNEAEIEALEQSLSEADRTMLDELATGIHRRRLTSPAMFFLESMKPMGFVSSQLMHFFRPMIAVVWSDPVRYDQVCAILEKRGSIELLVRRLEAIA
jgi:hypothetical protein